MIISIISVLLVLGGLIFFHELGHFLMARALGMGVSTFSIGFGPKLYSRVVGKTEYCLSLIPLGGYCALVGEDYDDDHSKMEEEGLTQQFSEKEFFYLRPTWQRFLVVAAGPFANIVTAFVLCWILAFGYGQSYLVPEVGKVLADSPAAHAGLKEGDIILRIGQMPIKDWTEMSQSIKASQGQSIDVTFDRAGTIYTEPLTPKTSIQKNVFGEATETYVIGVQASGKIAHVDIGFFEALTLGAKNTWNMVDLTYTGFVKLFQRTVPLDQVGGPIMIAQLVSEQAATGLANVLSLAALISINLAILNLLPIPVLDGGHIVFLGIETIMRRPLPHKLRLILGQVGFFMLIGIMIFATFNDIMRLFGGDS